MINFYNADLIAAGYYDISAAEMATRLAAPTNHNLLAVNVPEDPKHPQWKHRAAIQLRISVEGGQPGGYFTGMVKAFEEGEANDPLVMFLQWYDGVIKEAERRYGPKVRDSFAPPVLSQFLLYGPEFGKDGRGNWRDPEKTLKTMARFGWVEPGIASFHCWDWAAISMRWDVSLGKPFVHEDVIKLGEEGAAQWMDKVGLEGLDLLNALGIKLIKTFWGFAYHPILLSGYKWPPHVEDYVPEGMLNFRAATAAQRARMLKNGQRKAHEIHPATQQTAAFDCGLAVKAVDYCQTALALVDPSHSSREHWHKRLNDEIVKARCADNHGKNYNEVAFLAERSLNFAWTEQRYRFGPLMQGKVPMVEFFQNWFDIGAANRQAALMGVGYGTAAMETEYHKRVLLNPDETVHRNAIESIAVRGGSAEGILDGVQYLAGHYSPNGFESTMGQQ